MVEQASLKAIVHGQVQGVYFRAFTTQQAENLGLTGYARNLPTGEVEVYAEGDKAQLEQLVEYLQEGPPAAKVDEVVTEWGAYIGRYSDFRVVRWL
jgi:acylphosphatase